MGNIKKIASLYSGSGGNCLYVESEGARVIIDAGKSARTLENALLAAGSSASSLNGILITHEHTDHVSALATLSKKYRLPIHAVLPTAKVLMRKNDFVSGCTVSHDKKYSLTIGDMRISSFITSHDSAASVGYRIDFEDGDSLGIMTDTGIVTNSAAETLVGCKRLVLEANHDSEMLRNGPYPQYLKERVASRFGHLSNETAGRFAAYLAERGTEAFLLAHLSQENNTPNLAVSTVKSALGNLKARVLVASPDERVEL